MHETRWASGPGAAAPRDHGRDARVSPHPPRPDLGTRVPVNGSSSDYTPRFVDGLLDELMSELSAVMVIGPRACEKTTTAARRARTIVRLDEPNVAPVRSPGRLMAGLRALAVCTAGSPTETTIAAAAGVDVRTSVSYTHLTLPTNREV